MLYYPHYTPSRERLRSILLFSDKINLIVPHVDQHGVEQRGHVKEILEWDDKLVEFNDPEWKYKDWATEDGMSQLVEGLVCQIGEELQNEGFEFIDTDQYGHVEPDQDEGIAFLWSQKGWKYVAAEKLPAALNDILFQDGFALRVGHFRDPTTGEVIEHNGVLCHPKLADFVLCRLAREASLQEGLQSITFGGLDFSNHLFDRNAGIKYPEHALLQSTMDLFVPDELRKMPVNDFLSIRQDYSGVRRAVAKYLLLVSREKNLHIDYVNPADLVDQLDAARRLIAQELSEAEGFIGEQRFRSRCLLAFEAAATVSLAALGAHFGGPVSAAITTGVGLAGSALANTMSTVGKGADGDALSVAMAKARVERHGSPSRWNAPSFWRQQ